jgi:ribonuclease Z
MMNLDNLDGIRIVTRSNRIVPSWQVGHCRSVRRRMIFLALAGLALSSAGCSDSSAVASDGMCFDQAPLPLGTSIPSVDADCAAPGSAAGVARAHDADGAGAGISSAEAISVVLCGTGSAFPTDRVQACTAVFVNGQFLLFDAGDGAQRSMEALRLPVADLDAVFLTHFHSDHIADLGEVISRSWILGRRETLPVYGGISVSRVVDGFNAVYALDDNYRVAHHGEEVLPPEAGRAVAHTIDDPGMGSVVYERDEVTVTAFVVNHPPIEPALGYRIDYAGRSVVISGDTTATESLLEMSRDADVLVAEVLSLELAENIECLLRAAGNERNATLVRDIRTYHIGAIELAELAEEAGVQTLVLTHLSPGFANDDPRVNLFLTAPMQEIFQGELIAANDGTRVSLPLD